ncbi:hypothetical protein K7640_17665 [Micromonospora sp. PLK6-60]|uniref:hypothetical protein n=1 Tax=Micromonospora sp. PLK6-60 TaxID=2873383 RepID=UPI001CA64D33|nr:hypothetical protein [Micromonospora sp. PLK6-60]MBY8873663.1 hypothetical protein [Micromonospora sp. PLK6-60]
MPDFDVRRVDDAFAAFRSGDPLVAAPGVPAAQAVHRRRRTTRIVVAGVAAAVLVATPVLAGQRNSEPVPPPPATQSPDTPPTPVPSPSASADPSASATGSPQATGGATGTTVPDGRISKETLGNSRLQLPGWPGPYAAECPSGRVRFTDGEAQLSAKSELSIGIGDVVHLDVDDDGAKETAASLVCSGVEMVHTQVFVFDRDDRGTIVTMGLVTESKGDIAHIGGIRAQGRAVQVEVLDSLEGEGVPGGTAQHQWRSWSWNGTRFTQTGGPTSFPANPRVTDLAVSGGDVQLTAADAGQSAGTLTLVVRNKGPQRAEQPRLLLRLPKPFVVSSVPSYCAPFVSRAETSYTCQLPPLSVGAERTIELPVSAPRSSAPAGTSVEYSAEFDWGVGDTPGFPEPEGTKADNRARGNLVVG